MASAATLRTFTTADGEPLCPLRPGQPCTLCFPGASGPDNCGRVYLVMSDPALRAELTALWDAYIAATS